MRAFLCFAVALSMIAVNSPSFAQDVNPKPYINQHPTQQGSSLSFVLEDGTPVKLRIARTVSSADAKNAEIVLFEVVEDVKVHDAIVIPHGGPAWATVTEAEPKRRMGRGGKLNINIDNVRLVTGEKIPLRAMKDTKGDDHQGAMTGAIVATTLLFWPAAPLFLLVKGKDITIPKGTEITAYIAGDVQLGGATAAAKPETSIEGGSTSGVGQSNITTVTIKSFPEGAEITADGKLVGSTPSTIKLRSGEHVIVLRKPSFGSWERTVTINPGETITLDATLEKASSAQENSGANR